MRIIIVVILLSASMVGAATGQAHPRAEWYLNGNGTTHMYQIFTYGDDGRPRQAEPVATPYGELDHVAWPSALLVDGERWLIASGYDGAQWNALYRWTSRDGLTFTPRGIVFAANDAEPHGIGPAQVIYEPERSEPFTLYYLVRATAGPGPTIAAATSADGLIWTRRGAVLTAGLTQEAGGLSMSYACRMADGAYALFYSGYSADLTQAAALVATGPSVLGPFGAKTVLMEGDGFTSTMTSRSAEDTAIVAPEAQFQIGLPHLIIDGARNEVVVPVRQDGARLWFDRPLFFTHVGASITSMAASKIDPSYARQNLDGSWDGIVTMYGPGPSVFAEYTTEANAPTLSGPWTFAGTGLRFGPWLNATRYSTENPTPLVANASCAN